MADNLGDLFIHVTSLAHTVELFVSQILSRLHNIACEGESSVDLGVGLLGRPSSIKLPLIQAHQPADRRLCGQAIRAAIGLGDHQT